MAATVAAPKFFTYAPGKAPAGKSAQQIKLAPGQALHFQEGKGYYSGPAVPAGKPAFKPSVPTPPPPRSPFAPSTQAEIDAQATAQATAGLTPQQQEIRRQQQVAADQAKADEAAITGFHTAAGGILSKIGPDVGAGITAAATEQGQLGQGFANSASAPVSDAEAAAQAFAESQGQTGGHTTDPNALHDTIYGLEGAIPGDQLASEALNARTWADAQPAIDLNAGREELDARMAQARTSNDGYAQQLIQLAATFPGLKAQALTQLNQYEIDKGNYRTSLYNAQTQRQAEIANEKLAGLRQSNTNQEFKYKWATLRFKSQTEAAKAKLAGKTIDAAASRVVGHVVYKDGSQDPSIKVASSASTSPAQKAKATKVKATLSANTNAYKAASSLYGKPVANKTVGTLTGGKGKYMADPSAKGPGVFPPPYKNGPRTTNSLALAARTGQGAANYADAYAKVYATIGGDALIGEGLSKAEVATIVKKALVAAGWRPGK